MTPQRWIACLAFAAGAAHAHDTWFAALPDGRLTLATGNRFPLADTAVDIRYFVRSGCRAAEAAVPPRALELERYGDTATVLRIARSPSATVWPAACFVQLAPFDLDLPLDKVDIYFKEIRPSDAVRAAWAGLHARGLPFLERYTKSARIDLGAAAWPQPVGITMDAWRLEPAGPLAAGGSALFQLMREGRPLADFPVELINERSPLGLWFRTDAQGRVRATLPLPGRWLMRGTDLRVSTSDATRFESRFLAYSFDVAPAR
jgi:hypothetical protein